jgi:hypothetical protein
MWRRVVSEDRIASIFMVKESASEEPAWASSCTIGSLVLRLLGQCPLGTVPCFPPRLYPNPALICNLLVLSRPFPSPHQTTDFTCGPVSLPPYLYIADRFNWQLSLQLLAHAGSSLADSSTLKMEAIRSSETSIHTKTTRSHIPENGIQRKSSSAA